MKMKMTGAASKLTAGAHISSSVPTPNSAVMSFGEICEPIHMITCGRAHSSYSETTDST